MRRLLIVAAVAVAAAGCGSTKHAAPPTTTTAAPSPVSALPGGRALYVGGSWAVVVKGTHAIAAHLVHGRWRADPGRRVRITILGPQPGSTAPQRPQIAAGLAAPQPMVESGLWVDGEPLDVKGGGTPTNGTIYGAPPRALPAGRHVAVAYARTVTAGSVRAWSFRTP